VTLLVDVRTGPGSRKHPQFNRSALANALPGAGIAYEWRKELGGFRRPRPDSPHSAIRNDSFRGYADHMETDEFRRARDWLIETSGVTPTAVMCSETLWWRCHRRMIADALTVRGVEVVHLIGGKRAPHPLHPNARVVGDTLLYDVPESQGTLPVDDESAR